jgi:hypothetical protein
VGCFAISNKRGDTALFRFHVTRDREVRITEAHVFRKDDDAIWRHLLAGDRRDLSDPPAPAGPALKSAVVRRLLQVGKFEKLIARAIDGPYRDWEQRLREERRGRGERRGRLGRGQRFYAEVAQCYVDELSHGRDVTSAVGRRY